jgi:hypothetical protein
MWSVDPDEESINVARRMVSYKNFTAVAERGEDFLKGYGRTLDLVYLDGYDISLNPNHHSETRKAKYRKYLGGEIQNQLCYKMHLDCVKLIDERLRPGGLICINDVINEIDFQYKGRTAVPYLLRTGRYKIIDSSNNAILLQKQVGVSQLKILNPAERKTGEIALGGVRDPKKRYVVTLLGYTATKNKHTNWFPWNRFLDVFKTMGYDAEWCELGAQVDRIRDKDPRPRIWICWNQPTSIELIKTGVVHQYDVIFQKLTSLGKGMEGVNWGSNPKEYFKSWNWPLYQSVEYLLERGFNVYGFGCKTHSEDFPEKNRIVQKLERLNRVFWINWGSTAFSLDEIKNCKPVPVEELKTDLAYVGSKWGRAGRGNTDQWDAYIQPVLDSGGKLMKTSLHGSGFPDGMISDEDMKQKLREAKICPILHAPSWVAEQGIQDRFYTVFTAGRFGVVDNPGILDFFDEDEVVCETDPAKYRALTKYFMDHPEEQIPYIEKVQAKIRSKYNLYVQWDTILTQVLTDQIRYRAESYDFLTKVSELHEINAPFYTKKLE